MKSVVFALVLAAAGPALAAEPTGDALQTASAKPPVDPERMAIARQTVASILPPGTMQRIMKDSMGNMEDMMLKGMFDIKASDLGVEGEGKDKTLREAMAEKDPHFEERMRISNQVMGEEMGTIFNKMEPRMREGMARAYARRFTVVELNEINRFFASPAGGSFARQSFELMTDPELMAEMVSFMPELLKEVPAIAEKVKKATAHLPPPPDEEEAEEETASPVA